MLSVTEYPGINVTHYFFVCFQSLDLPKSLFKKFNVFLADLFGKIIVLVIVLSVVIRSAVTLQGLLDFCVVFGCCWCMGGRVGG